MYIFIRKIKDDKEFFKESIDMPIFTRKIVIIIYKLFKRATIKQIDESHYLYLIYCSKNRKNNHKYIEKKLKWIIKNYPKAKLVLSKDLKEYEEVLNIEKRNKLIKYFLMEVLNYILSFKDEQLENQNLSILVNEYNEENCNIIKNILKSVKTLTIVTSNISNYKKLEDKLYRENSILLTVTNNKKKALKKAKYIINLDFSIKQINEYHINRNAIIINCSHEKIDIEYFQGIIINKIEFKIKEGEIQKYKELIQDFSYDDIFESFENSKEIKQSRQNNLKDNIKNLYGNNGIISNKEFETK